MIKNLKWDLKGMTDMANKVKKELETVKSQKEELSESAKKQILDLEDKIKTFNALKLETDTTIETLTENLATRERELQSRTQEKTDLLTNHEREVQNLNQNSLTLNNQIKMLERSKQTLEDQVRILTEEDLTAKN
jgi:chromosome segregation ATPase